MKSELAFSAAPESAILGGMVQAAFRINQVTPGLGTADQSRHDLVVGEVITLVAVSPLDPGTTYSWEILDKRGSTAVLSAASGPSVTIGPAPGIVAPCAFLIQMTANVGGLILKSRRIASVRTPLTQLRVPVFPETAPDVQTLNLNDPDLSTDNAVYPNRSGLGVTEQNAFGWAEWAWELTQAVESLSGGGGGPNVGVKYWLDSADAIVVPNRYQYITKGVTIIDPGGSLTAAPGGQIIVI